MAENEECIGGMRNPANAVARSPDLRILGDEIRNWLHHHTHEVPHLEQMVRDFRSGTPIEPLPRHQLDKVRHEFLSWLGATSHGYQSPTPAILEALGRHSGDTDLHSIIPKWLSPAGAPFGYNDIPTVGIFPPVDPLGPPGADADSIISDLADWSNYVSVEESIDVALDLLDSGDQAVLPLLHHSQCTSGVHWSRGHYLATPGPRLQTPA